MMLKRDIGNIGENLAVTFLKKRKYKIIERNFNVPKIGEIDIIALNKGYLCFVEVRLRKSEDYGSGAETVDVYKQRRIIKAAQVYLKVHEIGEYPCRFDVVSIIGDGAKGSRVELIENAFEIPSQKF